MKEPPGIWVPTEYQAWLQMESSQNHGPYINDGARHKHEMLMLFNYSSYACVLKDW